MYIGAYPAFEKHFSSNRINEKSPQRLLAGGVRAI
jgi:hypothetical protein